MSLDNSATALVGLSQAQYSLQIGISVLKQQAHAQDQIASAIISTADISVYNATGRVIMPAGQIMNGRG